MSDHVWQRCLDVPDLDATGYHGNSRNDLVDALDFVPNRVLDIGCAAGSTGAYLKAKFPEAKVWGIELNKAAAKIAAERLDTVISAGFDEVELEDYGVTPGSLDLVFCADVLEHMYNPWQVMVKLQRYLSPTGKVVISIPNIRYLPAMDDLARGYWRYADSGILDITHLRFFTLQEMKRFLSETGYSIEQLRYGLDPTLLPQLEHYRRSLPCTIDTGKIVLREVDEQELMELHSGQFFITAKLGTSPLLGYDPPKMGCYFWRGQQTDYHQFLQVHQLGSHEAEAFDRYLALLPAPPIVDIIVVCNDLTEKQLPITLGSLARQLYAHISLTVVGQGPAPAAIASSPDITWLSSAAPWETVQEIFGQSEAEWLVMLDAGDQIVEHALPYIIEAGLRNPEAAIIYVDEDQLDAAGRPDKPYFKPGFSPDYLQAFPYLGDGLFIRREKCALAGGLRINGKGDPFYDLALRLQARLGDKAFYHLPDVLFRRHSNRTLNRELGALDGTICALNDYFASLGEHNEISNGFLPGSRQIRRLTTGDARVALITHAPNDLTLCRNLIEETYLKRTYALSDLIVFAGDNLSPEIMSYLAAIDGSGAKGIEVFQVTSTQSDIERFSAAIAHSNAEVIILLRPGLQPANPKWLADLVAEAVRPSLGAVAPRLLDTSGRVFGNALLLGCSGVASGFGHGSKYDTWGHFGRQLVAQNPSAVTFDTIAFRKETFLSAGGFDIALDSTACAIDFSLKLATIGLKILWTPSITLISSNNEISPIGAASEEKLMERWLPQVAEDPFYNRNLSRDKPFALLEKPQVSKLRLPWKPLPRLLAFPADLMGCGHYRVIEPFNAALSSGRIDGFLTVDHYNPYDLSLCSADTLLLQRQVSDAQLSYLAHYRKFFSLRLVYELDDLITKVPVQSFHKAQIPKDIAKRLRSGLSQCDRFIVSTEALAFAYREFNADIRVVPNRIDADKWLPLQPRRAAGIKPRVGWAGGLSHSGDLAIIADVVKDLADEVEWVFFGMCPDTIRPYIHEFHAGVPTPEYPAKLASLNLDLALAPLEHNEFNECKSNLKLLEYGVLGYPVIASDFGPYQCGFPVKLVKNRTRDWVQAIRDHLSHPPALSQRGDRLRDHVRAHWLLQDHLDEWIDAWFRF